LAPSPITIAWLGRNAEFRAHALHGAHLFLGVDDAAHHAAGQLAVLDSSTLACV
jgi:hypothetical protein